MLRNPGLEVTKYITFIISLHSWDNGDYYYLFTTDGEIELNEGN